MIEKVDNPKNILRRSISIKVLVRILFPSIMINWPQIMQTFISKLISPMKFAEKTKNIALYNIIAKSEALVTDFGCGTDLVKEEVTDYRISSQLKERSCLKD